MAIRRVERLKQFLRLLRIHQWPKNILVFIPLFSAHRFEDNDVLIRLFVAFFSFCICASSVYIINDLLDMEFDRRHPIKKHRPLAAGNFSPSMVIALTPLLLITSLLLGYWVGIQFLAVQISYFILACLYSFKLKKTSPLDCLSLATLYTLRVVGGSAAGDVPLSFWLLTFSFFIFFSLANLKRYAEIRLQESIGNTELEGRDYRTSNGTLVQLIGVSSGFTSSLVLALYLQGETVTVLYSSPVFIWMIVPVVLFWLNWLWARADSGEMKGDPLEYSLRDKSSWISFLLILFCFIMATASFSL